MSMDVVIVGAGLAGYALATALRKANPDMAITLVGDEPYAPYDRPPLSKTVIATSDAPVPYLLAPEAYAERDITLLSGVAATGIDRGEKTVTLADGRKLSYGTLVLANGGRARRLRGPGSEAIHYLRGYDDACAIREKLVPGASVVCIGAGVISLELAAVAAERGGSVHVIEPGQSAMARQLPKPESDFLLALHRERGTRFLFGESIAVIEAAGDFQTVGLASGETLAADLIVAGVGMEPNAELAMAAGLTVERGVCVDSYGRTSDPDIFAIGDVAAFHHEGLGRRVMLESWYNAMDQAAALAKTLGGTPTPHAPAPRFWTDQFGRNFQVAGDFSTATRFVLEGVRGPGKFTALYLDDADRIVFALAADDPRRLRGALKSIVAGQAYEGPAERHPLLPASAA